MPPDPTQVAVLVARIPPLALAGLQQALRGDHGICILADKLDGPALEREVRRTRPGVVIIDDQADYSLLVRLKALQDAPVVVVLAHDPPPLYRTMLATTGASELAAGASISAVRAAIHEAARRGSLSPEARVVQGSGRVLDLRSLTNRERQVAQLLARGWKYGRIAGSLGVRETTVKTHAANARKKLGLSSNEQLAAQRAPSARASREV